jgi:hypothetical protein
MRKLVATVLLLAVLLTSSCKCTAEKAAVGRLGDQQEKVFVKYTMYIAKDDRLDAAAKDDELKLLQSIRDIVASLKRSMGD